MRLETPNFNHIKSLPTEQSVGRLFYFIRTLFPKIRIKQAKQLPIPIASLEVQLAIADLVEKIIKIKKNSLSSTEKLEREIDKIVYDLFGLTEEEIRVVEENTNSR